MTRIELLDFQQEAADKLIEEALNYYTGEPDRIGGRTVPFIGQLKAVTGAGKTPILAKVVGSFTPSVILWTTKFGGVVDQTVTNLAAGGKYYHLLGNGSVEVIRLGDIASADEWQRILDRSDGLTILVSTVAAWNSSLKDDRLNVHRAPTQGDWGNKSRWDQLKVDRKRELWVVYDEGHNTTTEQIELLDELDPAGFFVASASPLKGKLALYLSSLPTEQRKKRVVSVSTRAVVDAQLLKSTISLADYESGTEEMINAVVNRRQLLEEKLNAQGIRIKPKAIYVVEESKTRPSEIWKVLVNRCHVSPEAIAVCTDTKDLPKDAMRVASIDQLSEQYPHIIFNKKLQEGWDDPSVYVCYFDGRTESATRIQQVLGRALRQPSANHMSDEDLNTAFFFINCPNELVEKITDDLKEELRIYKGDEPDNFEPFKIKKDRDTVPPIPLKDNLIGNLKVPRLILVLPAENKKKDRLQEFVENRTYGFSEADRKAPGKALVSVVSVRTGDITQSMRDLLEDMRVHCGTYLQEQIRVRSRNCSNSMSPNIFTTEELNKTACYQSKALEHYKKLAEDVVHEYENHVQLKKLGHPTKGEYIVEAYQPLDGSQKTFTHAGHPYYDAKSFNENELTMAKALDKFSGYVWVRNRDRLDYAIPLPIKSKTSSNFFPDFLWWVKDTVWAIDPTGDFILEEKIRTKLLYTPPPLKIALVTPGKYSREYKFIDEEGWWTLLRARLGALAPETFRNLEDLLSTLILES